MTFPLSKSLSELPEYSQVLGNLIAMSMQVFDLSRVHRYALRLAGLSPRSTVAPRTGTPFR